MRSARADVEVLNNATGELVNLGDDGRDELTVRVYGVTDSELTQAHQLVGSLPEPREAVEKNAGCVTVVSTRLEDTVLSGRQKQRQILDYRN